MIKMKRQCPTQPASKPMRRQATSETRTQHEEDRISELPEPIQHHILSFLPTFDAIKTSELSKTWNSTWKSFSLPVLILSFIQGSFQLSAFRKASREKTRTKFEKVVQDFTDFSINRLDVVDTNIQKFQLQVGYKGFKYRSDNIDRWLNFAINKNVQHLDLAYHMTPKAHDNGRHYNLPQSIFGARSLKTLELLGCKFIKSGGLNSTGIGFSLRELSLTHVKIDQSTLESVVSNSCCLLEELRIRYCTGFEAIKISGLSRLEKVDLYLARNEAQIVALDAPNLRCISYDGGFSNVKGSLVASRFEKITQVILHEVWIQDDEFFTLSSVQGFWWREKGKRKEK